MIFPVPQSYEKNGNAPIFTGAAFLPSGDEADFAAEQLKKLSVPTDKDGVPLILICERTQRTRYIDECSRLSDEKYYIDIEKEKVIITFSSRRGLFSALCTFSKLLNANELCEGTVCDYPLFEARGYIEGFYGKPWDIESKLGVMRLCAFNGMNTYFYAPKDDPYHREKWRDFYPQNETAELKTLLKTAGECEISFNYCIAPGLSIKYSDENEHTALFNKLKSLYEIGVRGFGLLLDDIPEKFVFPEDAQAFPDMVCAHAHLINSLYSRLIMLDKSIRLTVCPTLYHGKGNEYYISALGHDIPSDVRIFWTGAEICSRELTSREAVIFNESTRHKPLYWDNFPVNDCEMFNEMHIAPLIGRDRDLFKYSSGLISNVMEYPECSKFALITIADYLWNPIAYDAEKSFTNAVKTVLGDDAKNFGVLSDHLRVSCLTKESSVYMSELLSQVRHAASVGKIGAALAILRCYADDMSACCKMLADCTKPVFAELKRWSNKLCCCRDILLMCISVMENPEDNVSKQRLKESFQKYNADATVLTGFCLTELVTSLTEER